MNITLIIKGILIGIGKIIPGVSGSIIAISMNIYDKAIECITTFFNDTKNNFKYLINLSIGILIGIVFFSNILSFLINNLYIYTMSLFIGLIIGNIKEIFLNCKKNRIGYIYTILSFILMNTITFTNRINIYIPKDNIQDIIIYFISGILEGIGTIIPGISSTALLLIIGTYNIFIKSTSNIFNIKYLLTNIPFYLFFTLGLIISIIITIYTINYLFKNKKEETYSFILGIILSNILFLITKVVSIININQIIISIILIILGILISISFND